MRKVLILTMLVAPLFGQCVPTYDPILGKITCQQPGTGSNGLSLLSGTIDPSGSCTGVSTSGLTIYANSNPTTPSLWYCNASGIWERIQSTTMVGSFILNGLTGTQPATPATGYISCWLDSTLKLLECVDDAGTVSKIGGYYQNIKGAGKFEETANTTITLKRDNLQFRRGLSVWDDGTGTVIVDSNWLDLRDEPFVENFYRVQGSSTSGSIGSNSWAFTQLSGSGSTTTAIASAWPNLGVQRITSGTTAGYAGALCQDSGAGAASAPFGNLGTATSWGMATVFRINSTANMRFYAGTGFQCSAGVGLDGSRYMGIRFDTNASVPTPDTTNYSYYVKGDTGSGVAVDSGVPADGNFHSLTMYIKASGVVHLSLDGVTDKTFCAAGANNGGNCDGTITLPTSVLQPFIACGTDTTAAKTCDIDTYRFDPHVASFTVNKRN
jgi:hypothetical protein